MDSPAVNQTPPSGGRQEDRSRPVRDWLWPGAILVTLLIAAWFWTPIGRPALRHARDEQARMWIQLLDNAATLYYLDRGEYPPGDGSGSSELTKCIRSKGPKNHAYFKFEPEHRDGDGNVRNPIGEGKIIYYRCPGVRNPKKFDLWCEDSKGRADGVNNWEK